MSNFKTHDDNEDYIIINHIDLCALQMTDSVPEKIRASAAELYSSLIGFRRENRKAQFCSLDLVISKTDPLVEFLMSCEIKEIKNEDDIVTFKDLVNAFAIAAYEQNDIASTILLLSQEKKTRTKKELLENYDEIVINYILKNKDLNLYIARLDGTYKPKEYIVYENGEFTIKCLEPTKPNNQMQKQLKITPIDVE